MSSEWLELPLGECVTLVSGCTPSKSNSDFWGGSTPWISAKDMKSFWVEDAEDHLTKAGVAVASRLVPAGTTLLLVRGMTLHNEIPIVRTRRPATFNQDVKAVFPKNNVLSEYICYLLLGNEARIQALVDSAGHGTGRLGTDQINGLSVLCPPVEEQQKLSSFFSALDDRITLLRETNTTLEAIAQALFKSWFVDFDPVRAKMEGRAPEGMDEATVALFPDGLEESELGLVPRGWRVGRVDDLGEVVCGKTPPTSVAANYGSDVPFITIPDMHNLLAVTTTARSLSQLGADTQKKKYLPTGSICVSCIATPGLVVRVTTAAQTNQQINSVVPHSKWGKAFPLFLLRRIGDAVRSNGSGGSVFHNLSKSGFEQLPVLLATLELAQHFDDVIEPLVEKIIENQKQAQTLATLRDTLLPRLISGQLRLEKQNLSI